MTGRQRGTPEARARALQESLQEAAGMLPLDVVDPLSSDTRGGPPETVLEGDATHDRPAPEPAGAYDDQRVQDAIRASVLGDDGPDPEQDAVQFTAPAGTVMPGGFVVGGPLPPTLGERFPEIWPENLTVDGRPVAYSDGGVSPRVDFGLWGAQGPQFVPWRTVLGPDEPIRVTLPGVYILDAAEYHDPAITGDWLSNSDARAMTLPGCPAQWRYNRDNGIRKTSEAFAVGHAVHAAILGKGEAIAVRPAEFDSWRTKKSQAWRAEQERAGRSVILPEQAEFVEAMAVAVHAKPRAHELLSQPGRPEVALFWVDPETGVRRRALVDYLPDGPNADGVMEPVDVKSADSVAPDDSMSRKLYDHGWHRQATTIADGIVALGLARVVEFSFIVQSKTAPHLVTVVELDSEAERIGKIENRNAMLIYQRCLATDTWPDYSEDPVTMGVPPWIAKQYEDEIEVTH